MKKIIISFILFLFLFTPALADGHGHHKVMLMADKAWARATIGNSKNGAAYAVLKNMGSKDVTIVSGSSHVSERVELHTHIHENGVMKMRQVKNGIKITAGGKTELKPGGLHIMLMGLKTRLKKGDVFKIDLKTAAGDIVKVNVDVTDGLAAEKMGHGSHEGSHKGSHSGH